jgi:glutamine amidotransferase
MCRLYAFNATEPTKVECTLVHAQNALMSQSASDMSGQSHSEGWGVATFSNGAPHVERQAWAAYHGEHFERTAANIFAKTVLAHIRRASVGKPSLDNTHPFQAGAWVFAHNGTVPSFKKVKPKLLAETYREDARLIAGQTDSEHVFAFLRSRMKESQGQDMLCVIRDAALFVETCCLELNPAAKLGLNIILTDGNRLYGTRLGRTLYHVYRDGILDCQICGFPHVHHHPAKVYRACVVASEPLSDETWMEVPDRSVWSVIPETKQLIIEPLDA